MKKLTFLLGLLGVLAVLTSAEAQMKTGTLVNTVGTVAASSTSNNINSAAVLLRGGENGPGNGIGITFWPTVTGGNAANTENAVFGWAYSFDSNTWTTVSITNNVAINGTTAVVGMIELAPKNARWVRLKSIQNLSTNALTVSTSIPWSYWNP
jgi:hypothetical protein